MRSFELDFELNSIAYDSFVVRQLHAITTQYRDDSRLFDVLTRLELIVKDKKIDLLFRGRVLAIMVFLQIYIKFIEFNWQKAFEITSNLSEGHAYLVRMLRK